MYIFVFKLLPRAIWRLSASPTDHRDAGHKRLTQHSIVAWPLDRPSDIDVFANLERMPMINPRRPRRRSLRLSALMAGAAFCCLAAHPTLAADDDPGAPQGATVTVLKATKACFPAIVGVSGIVRPRDETSVRPERQGAKVTDVLVDAGETVTAGQTLARLSLPEGGTVVVQAPVAGLISSSTAAIGSIAGGRGDALFTIIARSEFDLIGVVPTRDLAKLKVNQVARIKVVGATEVDGKVSRVAPTVQPDSQLGQVTLQILSNQRLLVNSSGRALIKISQSCNVAVPLTAVLYESAGTVVQVVRRQRVETKRVEVGLMSGGQVEIRDGLQEGDMVVARAGAILREGDPVRPVTVSDAK
jgi:HlyD family secretion protein